MNEAPSLCGPETIAELIHVADAFKADREAGRHAAYRLLSMKEVDEGDAKLSPPEGEMQRSTEASGITPREDGVDHLPADQTLANLFLEAFPELKQNHQGCKDKQGKAEIARIGGVSRVWLNNVLNDRPVAYETLIRFLDKHLIHNQKPFVDANERLTQRTKGHTSIPRYERLLEPPPNGHVR